jgi:hypothetical protein
LDRSGDVVLAPSVFGGRPLFYDHFRGSGEAFNISTSYLYACSDTNAGFTAVKGATGTVMTMPASSTGGFYSDGMLRRPRTPGAQDIELLLAFIPDTATENFVGVWVRGDGVTPGSGGQSRDSNCYFFECDIDTGGFFQVTRSVAGAVTVSGGASPNGAWTTGVLAYLRVAAIGPWFFGRAWSSVNPEPPGWNLMYLETTVTPDNRTRFGVGFNSGNSGVVDYSTTISGLWAWDLSVVNVGDGIDYQLPLQATAKQRPRLMRV